MNLVGDTESGSMGGEKAVPLCEAARRQVLSIAQDIVHNKRPIKDTEALPMAVRHLTGSSKVLSILNQFGHTLSVTQPQELETKLTESHLKNSISEDIFVITSASSTAHLPSTIGLRQLT